MQISTITVGQGYLQWRSKRRGKWGHAPWGGGAPAHFLQSFKNAF